MYWCTTDIKYSIEYYPVNFMSKWEAGANSKWDFQDYCSNDGTSEWVILNYSYSRHLDPCLSEEVGYWDFNYSKSDWKIFQFLWTICNIYCTICNVDWFGWSG